jgi:DUF438 domain-containing protein
MEENLAPAGHPIHYLMEEHNILLDTAQKLANVAGKLKNFPTYEAAATEMIEIEKAVQIFRDSANHYLREENVIFPLLDKKGFSGPPAVMWSEHNQIRDLEKAMYQLMDQARSLAYPDFAVKIKRVADNQAQMLTNHFHKENNILFPTALEILGELEWTDARKEFEKIGFCPFTPGVQKQTPETDEVRHTAQVGEGLAFSTGSLTTTELEAIFATLPVEITFVDADDRLKFFSESKNPIFTRSTAALGMAVQNCHPQKSVHLVNQILAEFKSGQRDVADFRIHMQGKYVYIRYFAVRDKQGQYLGAMEVTQDIKDLQALEGEKRLL